jgi:hypothetical protein
MGPECSLSVANFATTIVVKAIDGGAGGTGGDGGKVLNVP